MRSTDISASSIAVNPRDGSPAQSCELKAGTSPSTEGVVKGTKVEIGCAVVDGKMTLLKLKKRAADRRLALQVGTRGRSGGRPLVMRGR